jgi:hypothetical protein
VPCDGGQRCCPSPLALLVHRCLPASLAPPARPQIPDSQKDVGSNHAVSALKFRILQNFLKLGYAVFLSGARADLALTWRSHSC